MSNKITYSDFIDALSRRTGQPKNTSDQFIKSLVELVSNELAETGKSGITNLGAFKVVEMPEREGVNPSTGEPMQIPAGKRISFSAFKALKEHLNEDMGDQEIIIPDNTESANKDEAEEEVTDINEAENIQDEGSDPFDMGLSMDINDLDSETESEDLNELATEPESSDEPELNDIFGVENDDVDVLDQSLNDVVNSDSVNKDNDDDDPISISVSSSAYDIFDRQISKGQQKDNKEESKKEHTPEKFSDKTTEKPDRKRKKEQGNMAYIIAAVIFVIAFTATGIYYFSNPGFLNSTDSNNSSQVVIKERPTVPVQAPENTFDSTEISATTGQITESTPDTDISPEVVTEQTAASTSYAASEIPPSYKINQDEWLWSIAKDVYGSSNLWPLIFEANQDKISDPDLILPDVELTIPALSGGKGSPSVEDYEALAQATIAVAEAYAQLSETESYTLYKDYSVYYSMVASGRVSTP